MTVNELINTLEENKNTVENDSPYCVIDSETRTITVSESEKFFGVTYDKNVEKKYFRCSKLVGDNIDLSQHQIYVAYAYTSSETVIPSSSDGLYNCDDVQVSGDEITFSWTLSGNVFQNPGFIAFKVMAMKMEGDVLQTKWNTLPAYGTVLRTIPDGTNIEETYPDVIAQILYRLDELEQNPGGGIPEGGTTGQVLTKNSDSDGDTIWKDPISGMTTEQVTALDNMFKICAFTTNPSSQYQAFCKAFGIEHEDVPEDSYTVSNNLTHVSNNNPASYVGNSAPYSATLTADEGYILDSVIVEMGGFDITGTAYSDGKIIISAVTGNIIITAVAVQSSASGQLPQDGLLDYFDLRNKQYTAGGGGLYYINSDFGNGMLYSWSDQSSKQGDEIGIKGAAGNYTSVRATGYPVTDNFPSTRTVCLFGKGGPSVPTSIGQDGTITNSFLYQIKYKSTDKSTKSLANERIQYPEGFNEFGYNASFVIVSQNILKVYFDDTLHKTVYGSEIEDFESWDITPLALTSFSNYGTAYAIYNKELSEVEIVEALEFFKTLEVSE